MCVPDFLCELQRHSEAHCIRGALALYEYNDKYMKNKELLNINVNEMCLLCV